MLGRMMLHQRLRSSVQLPPPPPARDPPKASLSGRRGGGGGNQPAKVFSSVVKKISRHLCPNCLFFPRAKLHRTSHLLRSAGFSSNVGQGALKMPPSFSAKKILAKRVTENLLTRTSHLPGSPNFTCLVEAHAPFIGARYHCKRTQAKLILEVFFLYYSDPTASLNMSNHLQQHEQNLFFPHTFAGLLHH